MRTTAALFLIAATGLGAEAPIQRVAQDATVVDRVAEASRKDLPTNLLKRIVQDDIDLLRGKRADGSFQFATFERLEAGRIGNDFSIRKEKDENDLTKAEVKGAWVYRLIVSSPSRRMMVTRNRRVWIDRVELELIPENSSATRTQVFKIETWLEPGASTPIDFPIVARQATARVFARADKDAGYGNVVLTLIQAKIVDNVDSPYATAVASAKALLRAIDNEEVPSIRAMATRLHDTLVGAGAAPVGVASAPAVAQVDVIAPAATSPAFQEELQAIEDLLTGTESERREGLDKLHQLLRRMRAKR
ncbi:MAG: hypothetical protein JJE51_07590 [Thermoanaerobaculia bacterium]|nr:hypothetical protein [Thermoanaerobaculia bacterium]